MAAFALAGFLSDPDIVVSGINSAANLGDVSHVPPPRRHKLSGTREGQYAVDLKHPWRLVFEPANDPLPVNNDGSLDLAAVTKVRILEVTDYH